MDFSNVKQLIIPEGEVKQIAIDGDVVWYKRPYDEELSYIECTGTQWIDTQVTAKYTTRIEAQWTQTEVTTQQQRLYGIKETDTDYFDLYLKTGVWNGRLFGTTAAATVSAVNGETYTLIADAPAGTITVNGTTGSLGATPQKQTTGTIPLFGRRNNGEVLVNYASKMKLHYFKIFENGVIVRNFIPVRVGTTGCLFDKVSLQLFENAATGSFLYG